MKQQISQKEHNDKEKEHASKSHGSRFLERQRLARLESKTRNLLAKEKDSAKKLKAEEELLRVALDQIYVAHFPFSKPYRKLFRNNERHLQHSVSRAALRHQILQDLLHEKAERVPWIAKDQYERLPKEWSVKEELELYKYPRMTKSEEKEGKSKLAADSTMIDDRFAMTDRHEKLLEAASKVDSRLDKEDNRFAMTSTHEKLLEAASKVDSRLDKEDNRFAMTSAHEKLLEAAGKVESALDKDENFKIDKKRKKDAENDEVETIGSSSSSESDSEEGDSSMQELHLEHAKRQREETRKSNTTGDSSEDDDSRDSEDEDDSPSKPLSTKKEQKKTAQEKDEASDSESSSSSSSSDGSSDVKKATEEKKKESSDSDSSSSSSSDSDSSDEDEENAKEKEKGNVQKPIPKSGGVKRKEVNAGSDSDDDFFMSVDESKGEDVDVFDKVKEKPEHMLSADNPARGDKSQGWATQQQRPGQFKKKRTRW